MSRNSESPGLEPYFNDEAQVADSGDELEPFNFDDNGDFDGPSDINLSDIGLAEDNYDAVNYETFGCAEAINNNDGLELLSEQTKLLELSSFNANDTNFDWPDPSTIPIPSAFKNYATSSSNFAAWIENADLQPSTSDFSGGDLFMFENESEESRNRPAEYELCHDIAKHWKTSTNEHEHKMPASTAELKVPFKDVQLTNSTYASTPQILTEDMLLKMAEEEEKQNLLRELGLTKKSEAGFEPLGRNNGSKQYYPDSQLQPTNVSAVENSDMWKDKQKEKTLNQQMTSFYQQNQPPSFGPPPFGYPCRLPPPFMMRNEFRPGVPPYNMYPQMDFNRPYYPNPPPHPGMMRSFNGINPAVMNLLQMHSGQQPQHSNFPCSSGPYQSRFNGSMYPQPPPPPPFPPFTNMLAQQRASMSSSMLSSNASLNSARTKKPFLPSNKTLSDFAFDPYAGLMSKKEREWLIKIQLIQCMISGDPIEDDYYYSIWKERNVLAKAPSKWRVTIQPKYYNFENNYPSERYLPPVFDGSLGRPTYSSTSFPRQIINIHSDSVEEDVESSISKSISQKKLRAILLRIENAALSLLECRDFLYKSSKDDTANMEQVNYVVIEKIQAIIDSVANSNELPTLMLVQKGRYLIGQLITYSNDAQTSEIMTTLIQVTPRFAHRIPSDSNNQPLLRAIVNKLLSMDSYAFKFLRKNLQVTLLEPLLEISFVQQLCLAFMIGFCSREISSAELTSDPIGDWLSDTDSKRFQALFRVLNQNVAEFNVLQLSRGLSQFPTNSIGHKLAEVVVAQVKHSA